MARHISPITQAGYRKGVPNANRGKRFYADTYSPDEVMTLVDGCNVGPSGLRDRAVIVLLWRTGLRISEALSLRSHDIDFDRRTIRVRGTKTRKADRVVAIDDLCFAHLRDWLLGNGHPAPPRSACTFCPYRTNAELRQMRDEDPEAWAEAVEFDAAVTAKRGEYVHRTAVPLPMVDLSTLEDHGQLGFQDECEGMCGV